RAGALDGEHLDRLAEQVGQYGLDRSIAAAVQHQPGIAAEQTRRVDAQGEIAADALGGVAVDDRQRVALDPAAFHTCAPGRRRNAPLVLPLAEHFLAPPAGAARTGAVVALPLH